MSDIFFQISLLNPKSLENQTLCSLQLQFCTPPEAQGTAHSLSPPQLVASSSCLLFSTNGVNTFKR